MANIKGIIVEIGGDTSKLQEALKKVNSSTASLSKELRGINSLLKLDPKNTELVSQKQTVLKQNIEETSRKLEELRTAQQMADETIKNGGEISEKEYRNLQREIINTENKLKQLKLESSNWTQAGRSIEEFGNKVTNISNKVDKMGTTLTTRLTLPILGLATATIKSANEFESAFTGVEKTVDGTAEQMANLKQGIKNMSEVIPASTTEISSVAEAAGQLGIQTDNVLGFTKTMINMGNATNLSADEAATTLARFANVTRMSQSDFDRLGSVIVALGNNFATTEAEISAMGMNLASAGTQVGMSQSQIMALATALSSVGLEAQAGGTAFSKVMVNMQLAVEKGGKELKNFASVAGMSTKQFKKAFKEDATSAIMQFVDGLSKSGERGKSAIKILDDMGITETRLRDALLRSANASEVMSKAIDLGNKAWEENTALTNEADKRYQTLDSRMEMTKNKIINVATNTGNKLTPTFNKLLDKVDGLADKFNGLNEEETKNVIKTLAIVAAIGPAIKILGMLGNTAGKTIKNIGTLSQTIGILRTGTESSNVAANNLANGIKSIVSPAGLTAIALTALTGAIIYLATRQTEAQKKAKELAEEMSNQRKTLEEHNGEIDKATDANLAHLNSVSKLKDELSKLVDENGKVKEGYEGRVSFILNELNNALGTEYKLNENIIESYQELQDGIDNLIKKKEAEIKLNAEQQKYEEAWNNQTEAVNKLKEAHHILGMSVEDARKKYNDYTKAVEEAVFKNDSEAEIRLLAQSKEMTALKNKISAYENAEWQVQTYTDAMNQYTEDYAKFTEGKYDEIGKSIKTSTQNWTDETTAKIKDAIIEQSNNLNEWKQIHEKTGNEVAQQNVEQAQTNLNTLVDELTQRTSTIGNLGKDEVDAWKTLATNSYDVYKEKISNMSPEMQQQIQNITGVLISDTSVEEASKNLAENVDTGFNNNVDGENWGKDLLKNLIQGLTSTTMLGALGNAVSDVAGIINAFIHHSVPDKGPLKDEMKYMPDMINNLVSGIQKNKYKVTDAMKKMTQEMNETLNIPLVQDFGKFQGSINNQITDSTKTIITTPQIVFNVQELDEAKLQQCFNYINRKFGSKY